MGYARAATFHGKSGDPSGVQYNPANQYLAINYYGASETRTYNSMNQMTRLTIPGSLDITYTFSSTANDGKITGQTDNISGETVTYQYDSLKRLIAASGSGWSESYGYDAFGSLVSKAPTGTAPTLSIAVNPATNQVVGQSYDANGNQTSVPGQAGVTYDAENRLLISPGVQYAYDSKNKRIWRGYTNAGNLVAQELYFYGVNGQKLGTYALTANAGATPYLADSTTNLAVFFRSKRIGITTNGTTTAFIQNRLGSQGNYYPYGEARGTVPSDAVGFASYTLDAATLLNYADQRYYINNFGRFMTPDPFARSGGPMSPASWNHYAYVWGDPINANDPFGLCGQDTNSTGADSSAVCGWTSNDVTGVAYTDATTGNPVFFDSNGVGWYIDPVTGEQKKADPVATTDVGPQSNSPDTAPTADSSNTDTASTDSSSNTNSSNTGAPNTGATGNGQLSPSAISILSQVYQRSAPVTNPCTWGVWVIGSAVVAFGGVAAANTSEIAAWFADNYWGMITRVLNWEYNKNVTPGRVGGTMAAVSQTVNGVKSACGW